MTAGVAWGWAAGVLGVVCLVLQFAADAYASDLLAQGLWGSSGNQWK